MTKRKGQKERPIWREASFITGIFLTVFVLSLFAYSLFWLPVDTKDAFYPTKWEYLIETSPNEIGDTLAGIAGSLAFVWLVVTVWLQATELREQRTEFKKMADAQQDQVNLLVKQGKIFEREQLQRVELEAKEVVDELVQGIREKISKMQLRWASKLDSGGGQLNFYINPFSHVQDIASFSDDDFFRGVRKHLGKNLFRLQGAITEGQIVSKPPSGRIERIINDLDKLGDKSPKLSEGQQIRFERYQLEVIRRALENYAKADIWTAASQEVEYISDDLEA